MTGFESVITAIIYALSIELSKDHNDIYNSSYNEWMEGMAEVREIDLIACEMTYIESWMAAFSAFERCEAACSSENKGPYFLGVTHYSYGEGA